MSALKGVYVDPNVLHYTDGPSDLFPLKAIHATRAMFGLQSEVPEGAVQYVIQTASKKTIGAIYIDFNKYFDIGSTAYAEAIEDGLNLATLQLAAMGAA